MVNLYKRATGVYWRYRAAKQRHRSIRKAVSQMRREATEASVNEDKDPTIRRIWKSPSYGPASKLAIFAHFDPGGRLTPAVRAYLGSIRDAGFGVVFVTSSPEFSEQDAAETLSMAIAVIWRRNVGHDFGAWRDGISFVDDISSCESILIVNDSVYGPLSSLAALLDRLDDRADVWALTESLEIERHLQSYFLYFRSKAVRSGAVRDFWSQYRLVPGRIWAVHFGELALSRFLKSRKLRLRAIASYAELKRAFQKRNLFDKVRAAPPRPDHSKGRGQIQYLLEDGHAVNPTHYFWREVLDDAAVPFVKRDLVDRNLELIADVSDARNRIGVWLSKL